MRRTTLPASFTGFGLEDDSTLAADFFYLQNAKPSTGNVIFPGGIPRALSGEYVVATTQPTFIGSTPHNNGDGAYDYSQAVHLVVWRTDTNATLLDKTYETTTLERNNRGFSRASEVVLPSNTPLKFKFRHQDSWGVWASFSAEVPFSCAPGPQAPTLSAPSGRTNLLTGNVYSGTYTHETGVASNAIQVRVYNEQGTQVIFDSGTVAKTVTHNSPWTLNQFHAALTNGATYQWEARFRAFSATAGTDVWGPFSEKMIFKVNSKPFPPTDMTPGQNRDTGEQTLRATVTDPDGDAISAVEVELFDITANAAVTGLGTPSVTGNVMTLNVASKLTSAVYNHQFRWRARASDGFVFGDWSAWEVFTFRASPQGTYVLPLLGDVRNDVKVPSAEFDDSSSAITYWTETGRQRGANFLTVNQSSAETDLTGIVALYDTPVTRSSTEHFDGAWSVRFDSTAISGDAHPRHGFYTDPSVASTPAIPIGSYGVVSASVKAPAGTTLTIAGRVLDEDDVLVTDTAGQQTVIATGSEQRIESLPFRYEFPGAEPGTTDLADFKAGVQVATPSGTGAVVYADKMQVEQVFNSDDVATDWEIGSLGLSSYIERVADSDAAFGSASWEAVNDGNRATHSYTSDFIDVDATKPRLFYAHVKKMTPQFTAFTTFGVECYNSSGTLLGTVYPSSISPSQDVDAATTWRAIGGLVWQVGSSNSPAYPSGTTKVKERWWPNTGTEPVTMRFDGAFSSVMPASLSSTDISDASNWYGYFDGETEGYGGSLTDAGYSWTGTLGASASSGLSIARATPLFIYITYSHPTSLAKNADKLTIYRQDVNGDWVSAYAGAWEVSTRTKIPIPANTFSSENRYKMVVELRDSSMIVAQMPELVFDVRFEGPPELNILIARADPTTAQVHLSFDGTSLGVTAFGGIEIGVGPDKTVVDLLTDPNRTSYVYPYPVSGEATDYWVRQVENRGADQVESRWDHAVVDISYEQWWLKDIEDPLGIALPVRVMAQDAPEIDNTPSNTSYRPWLARNRVHIIGPGRQESGSLVVRLKDSDQQLEDRLDLIQEIYDRRKVMCLLMTRPNQKRFVQILDIKQTSAQVPYYAIYELSWSEANFSEAYYEREKKS